MDQELAETLVQVCENDGLDVSLRESYSGRCMYGKDTVGVVLNEGDVTDILKAVINQATEFVKDDDEEYLEEIFSCNGFKLDSMGKGIILY